MQEKIIRKNCIQDPTHKEIKTVNDDFVCALKCHSFMIDEVEAPKALTCPS